MPDLPACAFVVPHLARSSRPERRLGLYRDGAFYVLIGWKVAARLICQNEHVAPLASVAYPPIECRQVLGKRSFEVRVVLPARLISDRFFASRSMNVGDTKRLFPLDAPASICRPVPALIDAVQFVMPPPQILRPPGLDERQYRDEVLIGQAPAEGGHPCLVIFQVGRLDHAALRDVEQEPIRMMPGMAALVMRPGRKEALLVGGLPIRLAFKVPAMARGAMLEIDSLAARNEFSIIGAKQRRGIPDQQQISADDRRSGRNDTSARGAILVIVGGRPSPARVNGKPLHVVQPSQAVSQTPGLAEFERALIVERTKAGLASARAPGRHGGRPLKMTPAKLRLARAAMGQPETKVRDLCAELGITRQTLYRFVGPNGELRADGEKLLAVARAKPEAFRGDRLAAFSAALDAFAVVQLRG